MNQPKGHLPFLDGIRGVAILAVFVFHSLGASFGFDRLGWNGLFRDFSVSHAFLLYSMSYGPAAVAVFFVVSGICIHLSHQQSREKGWMSYFNRRFFRIYPPYLLALLVFFFVWPYPRSLRSSNGVLQFGTHLFTVHNYYDPTFFGLNPSFWSIAVEIQLYAIYPVLLLIVRKWGWRKGLLFVGAIELVIRSADTFSVVSRGEPLPHFISSSPFAYWFSWSIGAYLAQCLLEGRASGFFRIRFDVAAVIALVVPLFKVTDSFSFLAFSLAAGVAIDRLISQKWRIPETGAIVPVWRHLSFLGIVSYSFYLIHQPVLRQVNDPFTTHHWLVGVIGRYWTVPGYLQHLRPSVKFCVGCAFYPVILLVSYSIYRLVEKPSIELGKEVWRRTQKSRQTIPVA